MLQLTIDTFSMKIYAYIGVGRVIKQVTSGNEMIWRSEELIMFWHLMSIDLTDNDMLKAFLI